MVGRGVEGWGCEGWWMRARGDHGPVRAETHLLYLPSFHFLEPTVNPFPSPSELIDGSCLYLMLVLESALLLLFWGGGWGWKNPPKEY